MKALTTLTTALLGLITTTTVTAYPTTQTLTPTTLSLYHSYNGRIEYDVPRGRASRRRAGNDDISTLLTFSFPDSTRGRKCEFNFELDNAYTWTTGTYIDVFTSSQIAKGPSPGWGPPSNYRDQQLGRLRLVRGGQAGKEWGGFVFDCPAGERRGFEVTPTGEETEVQWDKAVDGAWIRYY